METKNHTDDWIDTFVGQPLTVKGRGKLFLIGFLVVGIPMFVFGVFSDQSFRRALIPAFFIGMTFGVLGFIFGKRFMKTVWKIMQANGLN